MSFTPVDIISVKTDSIKRTGISNLFQVLKVVNSNLMPYEVIEGGIDLKVQLKKKIKKIIYSPELAHM